MIESVYGAVTCAACPESAWLVTFFYWKHFNRSGHMECNAVRYVHRIRQRKLPQTVVKTASGAKTWLAKLPLDCMLQNTSPWKWCGRHRPMWHLCSLCEIWRSFTLHKEWDIREYAISFHVCLDTLWLCVCVSGCTCVCNGLLIY